MPDALRNLTKKGAKFKPGKVTEWLDCGNKVVTVHTNQRVLEFDKDEELVSKDLISTNSLSFLPALLVNMLF